MALIVWNESLVTGNAGIDDDHKRLVSCVNELHEALAKGKGKESLGLILDRLITYTQQHFTREETIWTTAHYPELATHKQQHADLLARVGKFKKQFEAGQVLLTLQVMDFLSMWLQKHILGSDMTAARACLRAKVAA